MEINGLNNLYSSLSIQSRSVAGSDAVQLSPVDETAPAAVDSLKSTQSVSAQDIKQEVPSPDNTDFTPEKLAAFISAVADSRHYVMSPQEVSQPAPAPVEKSASPAEKSASPADHVPVPQATAGIVQNFDKIDTNNDGLLSLPEILSFGG